MIHPYPTLLSDYYARRLRQAYDERRSRLAACQTRATAERYRTRCRRAIAAAFGPLPPRTPLNARTVKTSDFGAYRVEHVCYESRPGFLVTANLYLPQPPEPTPFPAVLFTCGHSEDGKAYSVYVEACIRLVHAGYAVLSYDPINQGERELYTRLNPPPALTRDHPCNGHNIIGKQLAAVGEWFGAWRLWDGIRGVDYLCSRDDIDAQAIGVAGQSGGGTLSAYLWAMDERFCMVASSGWTTSYLRDIENGMPADNEQYPPGFAAAGLDKVDFFISRAGEPTLLLGQMRDIFDDRGLRCAYRELFRMHRTMGGQAGLCRLRIDEREHTLSVSNQRDMVRFFNAVLGRPNRREKPIEPPTEAALLVTASGQVVRHGSRPLYRLVGDRATASGARRERRAPEALARAIRQALGIRTPSRRPDHRRMFQTATRRSQTQQYIHRFIFEPEPGIICVLRHVCDGKLPHRMDPAAEVCLYLPNLGSGPELARKGVMPGRRDYWALDVRGLGESAYSEADFFSHYGQYYMAAGHAVMFGETLLGAQTFDVLTALALLRSEGARTVHIAGRGQGGVLALLAGCLDHGVATVTSLGTPESIEALCRSPLCEWPTSLFPFDVLSRFDLPDLRRALGQRLIRSTTASPRYFRA